ncbi:MAG: hypothetical protein AB1445_11330 [Bacillota bacterium]
MVETASLVARATALAAEHPQPHVPVDLEPYQKALGVHGVKELPGVGRQGALLMEKAGPVVAVPPGLPLAEQRWILANQLAAVMAQGMAHRVDLTPVALEFLLPDGIFGPAALECGIAVESIPELSASFCAPLRPTAVRFCELMPFKCIVAFWQPVPGGRLGLGWQAASPGLRARFFARATVNPQDHPFTTWSTGARSQGRQRLSLGGPRLDYYLESLRLEGGVLSLVILEKHAELLASEARRRQAHRPGRPQP